MKIWIDAQLSPAISIWLAETFHIESVPLKELGLRDATDEEIFSRAKTENAIVMSKDVDFVNLQNRLGSPPQIIWVTLGNTSNTHLKRVLSLTLSSAIELLSSGENLVEIGPLKGY